MSVVGLQCMFKDPQKWSFCVNICLNYSAAVSPWQILQKSTTNPLLFCFRLLFSLKFLSQSWELMRKKFNHRLFLCKSFLYAWVFIYGTYNFTLCLSPSNTYAFMGDFANPPRNISISNHLSLPTGLSGFTIIIKLYLFSVKTIFDVECIDRGSEQGEADSNLTQGQTTCDNTLVFLDSFRLWSQKLWQKCVK